MRIPRYTGQIQTARRQVMRQPFHLAPGDGGKRRHTAEVFVVCRHLLNPLRWHTPAAEHVGEKRPDVCRSLRASEGDDQHGVERPSRHARTGR